MDNIQFLEKQLRLKQKRLLETKKIAKNIPYKSVADYQIKMEIKKDIANLLVTKFLLYKEEGRGSSAKRKESTPVYIAHELIRKEPSPYDSQLNRMMLHEFEYYNFRKEDFVKAMLRDYLSIRQEMIVSVAHARGMEDLYQRFENFKNSDEHKSKTQVIANFFAEHKLRDRNEIIDVIAKAVTTPYRNELFDANHLDQKADILFDKMTINFEEALIKKDENALYICFKNYFSLYTFLINII